MNSSGLAIVRVDSFEPVRSIDPEQASDYMRRFGVLRLDGATPIERGGFSVRRALTAENRAVAVCASRTSDTGLGSSEGAGVARVASGIRIREEGAALNRLIVFKTFPEVYGVGEVDGCPVLIESWTEGVSLRELPARIGRQETPNGIGPIDVAVVGVELYRTLQALADHGGGNDFRGVSPDTVLIEVGGKDIASQVDSRDFELRFAVASAAGCNPADILLDMLEANDYVAESNGIGRDMTPTRNERTMLIELLMWGKWQRFDHQAMGQMLQRWIRVHDSQRLNADGRAPYAYGIDPRALLPKQQKGECRLGFGSRIISDALEAAEGDVDWMKDVADEMGSASLLERFRWWLARNFIAAWIILMFVYTIALLMIGWSLYPILA